MQSQYPVRHIDLSALRQNVALIKASLPAGTMLLAVVKADAYGHGIAQVARNALAAGADWLAVARTGEGAVLRSAGITAPVLVLGAASEEELAEGVRCGLTLALCTPDMAKCLQRHAEREGKTAEVHLKLDTGMGRIGARTEDEVRSILSTLEHCPQVKLTGAFTHFADADGDTPDYTRQQLERFQRLLALLPDGVVRHCANSASIHRYPEAAMDMVRAGISMYGCPPVESGMPLRPVMDWRTAVTFVKKVSTGDKVSYGCTFTADKPMRLATVAIGYGDGYHRAASGSAQVIIRGMRAPVVGRICMDQMMVDVSHISGVQPGDEVILMGAQGGEFISADELASWSNTISYEVLLAATERVHRLWVNDCE
ncbi:MAG: alanine racemase [Clostridia bacterium]|nr:alanine racemase [Clostridia bacterium]